jgi:hypothetical protein
LIFLMTTKPDQVGSWIAPGVALVLGVTSSLPWRRPRAAGALAREAQPGA